MKIYGIWPIFENMFGALQIFVKISNKFTKYEIYASQDQKFIGFLQF
jgi:hypothetical protein